MARDKVHDVVRQALVNDGWTITDDPYIIRIPQIPYQIDLGAERMLAAERDKEKIAVEIKGFPGASFHQQFHNAVGQYFNYLANMEAYEPDRKLYLAVPLETYQEYFGQPAVQTSIKRLPLRFFVFDPTQNAIIQWKK